LDVIDDQGSTPLHLAAALPDTAAAEALLAAGAKVSSATKERQTPLHVAAAAGNATMVELLMRSGGAEILTKGKAPTPIDAAEKAGKTEVAQLLRRLEFPAMLQSVIDAPRQPVPARLLEMIRKDPKLAEPAGTGGRNALHHCAASGNAALAAELIRINPALVRAFSDAEETPLHVAAAQRQVAVARVLLGAGASVRATTRAGDTALHVAAKVGSRETVQLLADAGADPALTNKAGSTPADAASDAATKSLLATIERDADVLRSAWSAIVLESRRFDVTAPGMAQPLRIRFRDRRNFTAEGEVNGAYKSFEGVYTRGALTLAIESSSGPLFPGIAGTTYSGKVNVGSDDTRFSWKVGTADIVFEKH
jgi:ankyrin repeat protein